jgi:hypothetical protein
MGLTRRYVEYGGRMAEKMRENKRSEEISRQLRREFLAEGEDEGHKHSFEPACSSRTTETKLPYL